MAGVCKLKFCGSFATYHTKGKCIFEILLAASSSKGIHRDQRTIKSDSHVILQRMSHPTRLPDLTQIWCPTLHRSCSYPCDPMACADSTCASKLMILFGCYSMIESEGTTPTRRFLLQAGFCCQMCPDSCCCCAFNLEMSKFWMLVLLTAHGSFVCANLHATSREAMLVPANVCLLHSLQVALEAGADIHVPLRFANI